MLKKFLDGSAKILIIEPSSAVRMMLSDSLRALKFSGIQGYPGVKDFFEGTVESSDIDLVFTILDPEAKDGYSAIALMQYFKEQPRFENVRVILVLSSEELYAMPAAFKLGAHAWLEKPFNKDSVAAALSELADNIRDADGHEALLASFYWRRYLRQNNEIEKLLHFERALFQHFPTSVINMVYLAEAAYLNKRIAEAKRIGSIVSRLDEKLSAHGEQVLKTIDNAVLEPGSQEASDAASIGIGTVMVVDSDDSVQNLLKETLSELGITNIVSFADGEAAANFLVENPKVDMIFQEWRLSKLTGAILLQRIRTTCELSTPTIIISSLVKQQDRYLLKEMGVSTVLEKPFTKTDILKSTMFTIQEERHPRDVLETENKFRNALRARDEATAKDMKDVLQNNPRYLETRYKLVSAEWNYYKKDYAQAKEDCVEFLKNSPESVLGLNVLGRILIQFGAPKVALRYFERAQAMSPMNIERLIEIAKLQNEIGETEESNKSIEAAKTIDESSPEIAEAEATIAMERGDRQSLESLLGSIASLDQIVSAINNKAIIAVRNNEFERSYELYEKALQALPENQKTCQVSIRYNFALARAKNKEHSIALELLAQCVLDQDEPILLKARSLEKKIKKALDEGSELVLNVSDRSSSDEAGDEEVVQKALGPKFDKGIAAMLEPNEGDERAKGLFQRAKRF